MLMIAVVLSLGVLLFFTNKTAKTQMKEMTISKASSYVEALKEFRKTYTEEIVSKAQKSGMSISHFYEDLENTLPLPATLTMLLGQNIGKNSDIQVKLYSPYPFPWRKASGGLKSSFSNRAWEALKENPSEPYFEFETSNITNREVFRYAVADIMQQDCVMCHNSHPQTPKADWKVGDVRGVLEVATYLNAATTSQKIVGNFRNLQIMGWLVIVVGLFCIILFFFVLRKNSKLLKEKEKMSQEAKKMVDSMDIFSK